MLEISIAELLEKLRNENGYSKTMVCRGFAA